MLRVFETLTAIGAVISVFFLMVAIAAPYAPAQNAAIGMAIAVVVIPYCVAGMLYRKEVLRRTSGSTKQRRGEMDVAKMEPLGF